MITKEQVFIGLSLAGMLFISCNGTKKAPLDETPPDEADTEAIATDDSAVTDNEPMADELVYDDAATMPDNDLFGQDELSEEETDTDTVVTDFLFSDDEVSDEDAPVVPDEEVPEVCIGIDCMDEHAHCEDNGGEPLCVCNDGYHDEAVTCVADEPEAIGLFKFSFSGKLNNAGTSVANLERGSGEAWVSYPGGEQTFGTKPFGNGGFPAALYATENGADRFTVTWVEQVTFAGTVRFLQFSAPTSSLWGGLFQFDATAAEVRYGDMQLSPSGGVIQCLRAISRDGAYNILVTGLMGQVMLSSAGGSLFPPDHYGQPAWSICP